MAGSYDLNYEARLKATLEGRRLMPLLPHHNGDQPDGEVNTERWARAWRWFCIERGWL